jgi:hypothetical protein
MRVPQVSERIKEAPAQVLRGVFAGIGQLLLITDKLRNKPPVGQQVPEARAPEPPETMASHTTPETVTDTAAASAPAASAATGGGAAEREAAGSAAAEAPKTTRTPRTARTPRATRAPRTPKSPAAPKTPKPPTTAKDFDKTGNVRLLGSDEDSADDLVATAGQTAPATAEEPALESAAEPALAAEDEAVTAGEKAARATPEVSAADSGAPLPNYGELSIASLRARLRNLDVAKVRELADYERAHAARADVITMFEHRIAKLEAAEASAEAEARAEADVQAEAEAQEEVGAEVQADVEAEAKAET